MESTDIAKWSLTLGLAFVFIYFGIDKFLNPLVWIGWMPTWLNGSLGFSVDQWLQIIAVTEIVFGAMLLMPIRIVQKIGSVLVALHLVAILTQTGWNDVAVRDIGLLTMAIALWYLI